MVVGLSIKLKGRGSLCNKHIYEKQYQQAGQALGTYNPGSGKKGYYGKLNPLTILKMGH